MGAGRSVVWSPGIVLGLLLHATAAGAQTDAARPGDAMAFIRVVADVRVDFGGTRAPIERKGVELATGSGFVIAPSGLVLTSLHVVAEEEAKSRFREDEAEVSVENRRIEVAIGSGGAVGVFEAHVVASDVGNDLAALQVTAADLPYLPLGDSDAVEPGRPVKVLGFPFGRQIEVGKRADAGVVPEVTVTAGSFSAARANEEGETRFLQTDATVNPGNSGGPMLDEDGYVVGVVKMKLARDAASQGAGFSVPGEPRRRTSWRRTASWSSCRWCACGRACGTPSTGRGSRSSCPTGTRTSRPRGSSPTAARSARSGSAPIGWRPAGRWRPWRR